MRRLLLSLACGAGAVAALLAVVLSSDRLLKSDDGLHAHPAVLFGFRVLGWALPVLGRLFPAPPGGQLKYSMTSLVLALLCDVAVAAALAYFVLRRRGAGAAGRLS